MSNKKKYMKANEIETPTPAIEVEAPKVETKANAKELCRACCVSYEVESVQLGKKKFIKCKGCGFLASV